MKMKSVNENISNVRIRYFINLSHYQMKINLRQKQRPKGGSFFYLSGNNLAIRVPFNRRSWVTRLPKIFKKLRECVFLPGKSNLVVFFRKEKLLIIKTAHLTAYFSVLCG